MTASFARFLRIERLILLPLLALSALIVLATSAAYITTTHAIVFPYDGVQPWLHTLVGPYVVLDIVVGAVTVVSVVFVLAMGWLGRGAVTSMIVFELCWLGALDILWLAAAASTAVNFFQVHRINWYCFIYSGWTKLSHTCNTIETSMSFALLNATILTIHIGMVLILALMYQQKGVFVWKRSVSDVARLDVSTSSANVDVYSMKTPGAPYDSESLPPSEGGARGV